MASVPSLLSPAKAKPPLLVSGLLSRDLLTHLFRGFASLTSQPDVKKRVADAVRDRQEAVAVTTAIKKEIFLEMGIGRREEMICDEAELGPKEFAEKMCAQEKLQDLQLEMLKRMRQYKQDEQLAIFEVLQQQIENANFDSSVSVLTLKQMENLVQSRSGR